MSSSIVYNYVCILFKIAIFSPLLQRTNGRLSHTWSKCTSNEFFDTTAGTCVDCADYVTNPGISSLSRVADTSDVDVYGNAISCKCPDGSVKVESACSTSLSSSSFPSCADYTCSDTCTGQTIPSVDQSRCISCGGTNESATFAAASSTFFEPTWTGTDCTCGGTNSILVDKDVAGNPLDFFVCNSCPTGSQVSWDDDKYTCVSCPGANMIVSGSSCLCDSGYEFTGVSAIGERWCLKTTEVDFVNSIATTTQASSIRYREFAGLLNSPETVVSSLTYQHYYLWAASQCAAFHSAENIEGCQCLANLCAMRMFNLDAKVCELYDDIHRGRNGEKIKEMYDAVAGWVTVSLMNVNAKLAMQNTATTSKVARMAVGQYSLNGAWNGFAELTGDQFWYCGTPMPTSMTDYWLKVGASIRSTYECNITWLAYEAPEPIFYDPYVVEDGSALPSTDPASLSTNADASLYPAPVRYINYRLASLSGEAAVVNANEKFRKQSVATQDDLFTTRFFNYDTVGAIQDGSSAPTIVKYLSYVLVEIRVYDDDDGNTKMYPPLISVRYRDVQLPLAEGSEMRNVEVHVTWSKDESTLQTTWHAAKTIFGFSVFFWVFYGACKMINEDRRLPFHSSELSKFVRMIWHAIAATARCGLPILCAFTWFYLFFFKWAADFHSLPLPWDWRRNTEFLAYPQQCFVGMMCAVTLGAYLRVGEIIYTQCRCTDVFFVDWEKSRYMDSRSSRSAAMTKGETKRNGGERRRWPISVWRTISIAKEWANLQTARRTNFELTLVSMLFLFIGCDVQRYATSVPELHGSGSGYEHPYLVFANISFWWFFVVLVQRLLRFLVFERFFVENRSIRFMSLCSLSKISLLVLDEQFHGYYIHGRSSHPYADVSMVALTTGMKAEANGEVAGRGLTVNTEGGSSSAVSKSRSFEFFASESWREHFDSIYWSIFSEKIGHEAVGTKHQMQATVAALRSRVKNTNVLTSAPRDVLNAHKVLQKFLKLFFKNDQSNENVNKFECKVIAMDRYQKFLGLSPSLFGKNYSLMSDRNRQSKSKADDCYLVSDDDLGKMLTYPGFESVLFMGVETDLVLFNMLNFCVWYFATGNYVASALLTYVFYGIVRFARDYFGRYNIAHKSLLDERFTKA
eukprot:g330.t1